MLEMNDIVSYGAQGVCRITGLTEKHFGDVTMEYYVLEPVYQKNSTIFVPINNDKLVAKMRKILSADEVYELIRTVPDQQVEWIEDENQRKQQYQEILSSGDKRRLMRTIKALYTHRKEQYAKGKKLHQCDERFFKEAEDLLYNEFALVLDIKPDQVLPFIIGQIEGKTE